MELDEEARIWLKEGVNVDHYFKRFKGNFKEKKYNSATPPEAYFPNSSSCKNFGEFISSTIAEKIQSGTISVWAGVRWEIVSHHTLFSPLQSSIQRSRGAKFSQHMVRIQWT